MDKAEATAVLREIFAACPDIGNAQFVSLDYINVNSRGFYRIRLRVNLDDEGSSAIKPVLDRHNLEMKHTKEIIDVYPAPIPKC